jgi:hypothetical protein
MNNPESLQYGASASTDILSPDFIFDKSFIVDRIGEELKLEHTEYEDRFLNTIFKQADESRN